MCHYLSGTFSKRRRVAEFDASFEIGNVHMVIIIKATDELFFFNLPHRPVYERKQEAFYCNDFRNGSRAYF